MAGVAAGEAILEVDGKPVYSIQEVRTAVSEKAGKEVQLMLADMRTNSTDSIRTLKVIPSADATTQKGVLGVYMTKVATIHYDSLAERLLVGPLHAANMLEYTGFVLSKLISVSVETKSVGPVSEGVSGPVGIYSVIGGILQYGGAKAILSLLDFVALMSLSLAFMNILPIPALDGGRIAFVVLEMVRGKRLSLTTEANIHRWGMILLLGLIFLVTIRDVSRLFF
jgi:regulator of sigma E protease